MFNTMDKNITGRMYLKNHTVLDKKLSYLISRKLFSYGSKTLNISVYVTYPIVRLWTVYLVVTSL